MLIIFEKSKVFRTSNLVTFRQGSSKAAYGGLIFAQALAAAENTVDETLKPHAMHSFFILCVNTSIPVQYHVRRVRDGRSFCTRTVEAIQDGKIVFVLQVSFHKVNFVSDSQLHRTLCFFLFYYCRIQVKPVVEKRLKNYDSRASQDRELFEVQIRPTDAERHLGFGKTNHQTRTFYSWFKSRGSLGDCEKLHRYLVAYTTDATMAGSAYRPHLVNDFNPTMLFSLDHNVWMHKHEMRADRWMLFENTSTVADRYGVLILLLITICIDHDFYRSGRGRAFITGKLWSEEGILLLSCTQEVVLRGNGQVSRL
ncbi:unnamed protein product [Haemonchus placei]|uniref:Acyl_CoA_thio domain-containing protein n=1 Tax=Haemonchus placei TaxID=6290 RepID=A0A0N4WWR4_HAEPC|nr:unnamed protein product [Haemonchus placei]